MRHSELYNLQARECFLNEKRLDKLPNLRFTRSPEESMALNRIVSGAIIIAGSGMCEGGRIRHHLKNHAWRRNCHILMVGFQARNTLGRRLVEGVPLVRIWNETIRVAARVHTIGGFSAHADQNELIHWLQGFDNVADVRLVHGESSAQQVLQREVEQQCGFRPEVMVYGESVDLIHMFDRK